MKKTIFTILKVGGIALAVLLLLVGGAVVSLNTSSVQNKLIRKATEMLSEKLNTVVTIDSLRVGFLTDDIKLYRLYVEDQQQRPMLQLDYLGIDIDMMALLRREVLISEATVDGLRAQLFKPSKDEPANYQFIIDSLKSDKPKKEKDETKKQQKLVVDLKKATLTRLNIRYNDLQGAIGEVSYDQGFGGKRAININKVETQWVAKLKKGPVDNHVAVGCISYTDNKGQGKLIIDDLAFVTDNHLPRKNTGRPHFGAFDPGHLDILASLKADVHHVAADSLSAELLMLKGSDRGASLNVEDLTAKITTGDFKTLHVADLVVKLKNTTVSVPKAELVVPSKKEGRKLNYTAPQVKVNTQLRDIAKPFAPALSRFTEPLFVTTSMTGDDQSMHFNNVNINTADKQLVIKANGGLTNLSDKYKLVVAFNVSNMTTKGHTVRRIINQFAVKKFMMKQLDNLGTIRYSGHFRVPYHREEFAGLLSTSGGKLRFNLTLNENTKYLTGHVSTDSLQLGRIMEMPKLGKVVAEADFKFDYSKPRTAKMRRQKGGKLPIGNVKALVKEAKYGIVTTRNVDATIVSDGAVATGDIVIRGKRMDVLCGFSFTNTDAMNKIKVKPGIKFHKRSDDSKKEKKEKEKEKDKEKAPKEKKNFLQKLFGRSKKAKNTDETAQ